MVRRRATTLALDRRHLPNVLTCPIWLLADSECGSWSDYHQRAYYKTYDVTSLVKPGANAIGSWVAEGWYSAAVKQDRAALETLLADDPVYTHAGGQVQTKSEYIAGVMKGASSPHWTDRFIPELMSS